MTFSMVLCWLLSHFVYAPFLVEALQQELPKHRAPSIPNSDQDSLFTRSNFSRENWPPFHRVLLSDNMKISMDGRGRWINNRMIEGLWRQLKYECVYLNAFETGSDARNGIGAWISYYNERRPHSSHGLRTPAEACDNANEKPESRRLKQTISELNQAVN